MKWHLSHYIVPFELLCLEFFFRWLSLPHSNYKTCQTFSNNSEQLQHVEISLCNFSLQMNFHEHLKIVQKQKRNCCFHMCTSTVNVYMNTHLCPEMNAEKKKKRQIWQNFIKMSKYLRIWPFWQIFVIFVNACISEHWMPVQTQLLNKPCQQKADPWNQVLQCSGSEHSLFSGLHS